MRFWGSILIAIIVGIAPLRAQDHLVPEDSVFTYAVNGRDILAYRVRLGKIFYPTIHGAEATLITVPSFHPEYAMSIARDEDKYIIRAQRTKTNFWYHAYRMRDYDRWKQGKLDEKRYQRAKEHPYWGLGFEDIEITHCDKELEPQLAAKVLSIWQARLLEVRHIKGHRFGLDGVRYHFSYESKAGQIWSPSSGSRMDKFVRLAENLIAYCEGDSAEPLNKVTLLADELLQE